MEKKKVFDWFKTIDIRELADSYVKSDFYLVTIARITQDEVENFIKDILKLRSNMNEAKYLIFSTRFPAENGIDTGYGIASIEDLICNKDPEVHRLFHMDPETLLGSMVSDSIAEEDKVPFLVGVLHGIFYNLFCDKDEFEAPDEVGRLSADIDLKTMDRDIYGDEIIELIITAERIRIKIRELLLQKDIDFVRAEMMNKDLINNIS